MFAWAATTKTKLARVSANNTPGMSGCEVKNPMTGKTKVRLLIDFEKILEKLKTENYTSIVAHAINNKLFNLGIHYINNINRRQVSIISTRCRWRECTGPDALPSTCTNLKAIQVRNPGKLVMKQELLSMEAILHHLGWCYNLGK